MNIMPRYSPHYIKLAGRPLNCLICERYSLINGSLGSAKQPTWSLSPPHGPCAASISVQAFPPDRRLVLEEFSCYVVVRFCSRSLTRFMKSRFIDSYAKVILFTIFFPRLKKYLNTIARPVNLWVKESKPTFLMQQNIPEITICPKIFYVLYKKHLKNMTATCERTLLSL